MGEGRRGRRAGGRWHRVESEHTRARVSDSSLNSPARGRVVRLGPATKWLIPCHFRPGNAGQGGGKAQGGQGGAREAETRRHWRVREARRLGAAAASSAGGRRKGCVWVGLVARVRTSSSTAGPCSSVLGSPVAEVLWTCAQRRECERDSQKVIFLSLKKPRLCLFCLSLSRLLFSSPLSSTSAAAAAPSLHQPPRPPAPSRCGTEKRP